MNAFAFTGLFSGDFPAAWWLTMLVIAVVGGFGMGTSIDWYPEAQRIQSAGSVRDAAYGIWAGGAITLIRNGFWAASILAFFVLAPGIPDVADYELGWFRLGFELLMPGQDANHPVVRGDGAFFPKQLRSRDTGGTGRFASQTAGADLCLGVENLLIGHLANHPLTNF